MKRSLGSVITLSILLLLTGVLIVGDVLIALPKVHQFRKLIDNDRASIIIIQQQQSNLTKLSKDIDTIREQQAELDQHVWSFENEDDFFNLVTQRAADNHLTLTTPTIADATPNGTLLQRAGVLIFTGTTANLLSVITTLQHESRLIIIKKITLTPATTSDTATAKLTFTTLWK